MWTPQESLVSAGPAGTLRGRAFRGGLFATAVLLWHGLFLLEPQRLQWFGLATYPQFIDSVALLAAGEAAQLGLDVYRPNPLDPYGRAHSYPSAWLLLGDIGLTRQDNTWFAVLAIALALFAALWTVRPQSPREMLEGWAAIGGPGVLFAVYRGNNDLWIFALLSLLVPCVTHRLRLARLAGPFVVACATALKYYPLVAGVLLLAEPVKRDRWLRFAVLGLLLAIVGIGILEDVRHLGATQPVVDRFWSFGAALGLREAGLKGGVVTAVSCLCGALVAVAAMAIGWRQPEQAEDERWQDRAFLLFLLGGSLLAGCFWAGASWGYRWIFAAWLLPWFWQRRGDAGVLWRIARGGWWLPMWFAPLFVWVARGTGSYSPAFQSRAWWLSQAIEWLWFGAVTALVAREVGLRVRRLRAAIS